MKIVIFPGVGLYKDDPPNRKLLSELKNIPDVSVEWFNWKNSSVSPDLKDLSYISSRKWCCEVILDFQTVVKHAFEIKVPSADIYIGHSAGSILAVVQPKPCIIFGSPVGLIESIQEINAVDCLINPNPVLNIVHKKDIIAYPFKFAYNIIVKTDWWKFSSWSPLSAHTCYWNDDSIIKLIISTVKEWKKQ